MNLFEKKNENTFQLKKIKKIKRELKKYIRKKISSEMFAQGAKMHVNINDIFVNMILSSDRRRKAENVVSHLAGIYGTVLANKHYKGEGIAVSNEVDIKIDGNIVTSADLVFMQNDRINYCELKTIPQLLLSRESFNEGRPYNKDFMRREDYLTDNHDKRIVYESSGNKLLKQVTKLKEYSNKEDVVNVLVFKNIFIDKNLYKLLDEKANIIYLPYDIDELFQTVSDIVSDVYGRGTYLCAKYKYVPDIKKIGYFKG